MYVNTLAVVITPEGEMEQFPIDTSVLQGDPLAPFLFIICLNYTLRWAITDSDGLTLKHCRSSRHPAVVLPDLDYADDIALLENSIKSAQDLLICVEKACQDVGLFLNAPKTKYMYLKAQTTLAIGHFSNQLGSVVPPPPLPPVQARMCSTNQAHRSSVQIQICSMREAHPQCK